MDLTPKAKQIIGKILYINIATVTENGMPWNTPVFCAFDRNYAFYWVSDKLAIHSQNIARNSAVFLVLYDSSVPAGKGEGVYIQAVAKEVTGQKELAQGYHLLLARDTNYPWNLHELTDNNRPKLYKAIPEKIWMNLDSEFGGIYIDTRVEVNLL